MKPIMHEGKPADSLTTLLNREAVLQIIDHTAADLVEKQHENPYKVSHVTKAIKNALKTKATPVSTPQPCMSH